MSDFAPFISSLWNSIEKYPDAKWKSALSYGQLHSKEWLIEKANGVFQDKAFNTAFVIGGWYGLLPALWRQKQVCPIKKFRSIDIDETCRDISESVNKKWVIDDWQFKAATADALALNYFEPKLNVLKNNGEAVTLYEAPDLIINTCCEHFENLNSWLDQIPKDIPLILQSNNLRSDPQHVACHDSLKAFQHSLNLATVLYAGDLKLDDYTRYMVIGHK